MRVLFFTNLIFVSLFSTLAYAKLNVNGVGSINVVFESGMGDGEESWKEVAVFLSQCVTVITYERGETQLKKIKKIHANDVAKNLYVLLRNKKIPPPYIMVGHSLGGLYTQAFTRNYPDLVSGLILIDATSPLEPHGLFKGKAMIKAGSYVSLENDGIDESISVMNSGPPMPNIPLIVIAANDHHDTIKNESIWQDIQHKTAMLSDKGKYISIDSEHYIQKAHPEIVIKSILDMISESGGDISSCIENRRQPE
ncbi:alpha/beta fold hydrolase [Enterobacter roggenkampii]